MKRFEYKLLDDGEIEIRINGRDKLGADGKYIDLFNQKKFRVEVEELIIFQEALFNALCDVMKKEKKDEGVNSKE
jgi:hypothetical protein